MSELLCQHVYDWNKYQGQYDGLVDPVPLPASMKLRDEFAHIQGAEVKKSMIYRTSAGDKYYAGDVVLLGAAHGHSCGLVEYHVTIDGVAWTRMEVWPVVAAGGHMRNKHRVDNIARFVRSTDMRATACYRKLGGFVTVCHPLHYVRQEETNLAKPTCARTTIGKVRINRLQPLASEWGSSP